MESHFCARAQPIVAQIENNNGREDFEKEVRMMEYNSTSSLRVREQRVARCSRPQRESCHTKDKTTKVKSFVTQTTHIEM